MIVFNGLIISGKMFGVFDKHMLSHRANFQFREIFNSCPCSTERIRENEFQFSSIFNVFFFLLLFKLKNEYKFI